MPLSADYISNRAVVIGGGKRRIDCAALVRVDFVNPATIDADGYSASHTGPATSSTVNMTLAGDLTSGGVGRPDMPRNVIITVTHASSIVAMSGVVTGTDAYGSVITDTWSVTATGTSKTSATTKAFKTITSITETVVADASANSIVAGTGKTFEMPVKNYVASAVKEIAVGSVVTNGTLTAASATTNGTYTPNGNPNGSDDYTVYIISDFPEQSLFSR